MIDYIPSWKGCPEIDAIQMGCIRRFLSLLSQTSVEKSRPNQLHAAVAVRQSNLEHVLRLRV